MILPQTKKYHTPTILFLAFFLCISSNRVAAQVELKPLYEIGAGVMMADYPDYPGAGHNNRIYLPYPSFIFRGEVLRAEQDEGVRGRFINHPLFELDLSFDGTLPAKTKNNKAREGMPDLDLVIEFGPKLIIHAFKYQKDKKYIVDLHLAARYGFSSDIDDTYDRGVAFNPFVSLQAENIFLPEDLFALTAGIKYASRKLMGHYYDVPSRYATALRPQYRAHSGLMEKSFSASFFIPLGRGVWLYGGLIKAYYNRVANLDSPLLVKKNTSTIAAGVTWNFYQSPIMVLDR